MKTRRPVDPLAETVKLLDRVVKQAQLTQFQILTINRQIAALEKAAAPRVELAALILNGMISSPPIVDRTKVNKKLWARIAVEWADALLAAAKANR